jgi:hypothetical protein
LCKEVKIGYPRRIEEMRNGEKVTRGEREDNWLLGMVERRSQGGRKKKKKM